MIIIRYIFAGILIFSSFTGFSQKEVEKEKFYRKLTFGIVALNFDFGKSNIELPNSLPPAHHFLMSANRKYVTTINIAEVQLMYKNFIGLSGGINYSNIRVDKKAVYNELQNYVEDVSISIPESSYEKGVIPIKDAQDIFSARIALIGNLNVKKISFVPYVAGIFPFDKYYLNVEVDCFDASSNASFDRVYSFEERYSPGIKAGFDTRYMVLNNLFVGVRVGYSYLKMKGHGTTTDKFEDGSELVSTVSDFYRVNSNVYFGANIGIVFGYGHRSNDSNKGIQ